MRRAPSTRPLPRLGWLVAGLVLLAGALVALSDPNQRRLDLDDRAVSALGAPAGPLLGRTDRPDLRREPAPAPPFLTLTLLAVLATTGVLTLRSGARPSGPGRRTGPPGHLPGPPPDRGPPRWRAS